jgi:hypothetical protein
VHHALEARALAAQRLGTLGVVPDIRLRELELDFLQPVRTTRVVKETP